MAPGAIRPGTTAQVVEQVETIFLVSESFAVLALRED